MARARVHPDRTRRPSDYRLHAGLSGPIGVQKVHFELTSPEAYRDGRARANLWLRPRISQTCRNGTGEWRTPRQLILVDDEKVVNTSLRFPDEFARHKVLDMIGDLYLLGRPIYGHVTAARPAIRTIWRCCANRGACRLTLAGSQGMLHQDSTRWTSARWRWSRAPGARRPRDCARPGRSRRHARDSLSEFNRRCREFGGTNRPRGGRAGAFRPIWKIAEIEQMTNAVRNRVRPHRHTG